LLVFDPDPGTPTPVEVAHRRSLASAMLANPDTEAGPEAVAVLRAAAVDARLLTLLAGLTARSGIGVRAFPAAPGELAATNDGPVARTALVTSLGGEPVTPGSAATDRLLAWLNAQRPPFAPDTVRVTGDGVLVGFRYASDPDALVTAATR